MNNLKKEAATRSVLQKKDSAAVEISKYAFFTEHLRTTASVKKENVISSRKFFHIFRFIDDLINISNKDFEKTIWNIYPAELELQKFIKS